jgi:hypothetical protein
MTQQCPVCHADFELPLHVHPGSQPVYCSEHCKKAAARKRCYEAHYKSLGLFVPGIMKKTKEHKREWGYT